jgi:hypothetical protein
MKEGDTETEIIGRFCTRVLVGSMCFMYFVQLVEFYWWWLHQGV